MLSKLRNKKVLLGMVLTILFCSLNLISYTYTNQPSSNASLTNAPSEGNCTSCHGGGGIISSGNSWKTITLTANGGALEYFPDSNFNMVLIADISGITKYGYQITAIDSSTSKTIGTLTVTNSTRTTKFTNSIGGSTRQYISHKSAGTAAQNSNEITVNFDFKAPSTLVKVIKFYVVVNATNSDGSDNGDAIYAKTFSMRPSSQLPTAKISVSNTTICQGDTLFAKVNGTNIVSDNWIVFNGSNIVDTSTAATPYFIMNNAGTFKLKYVGTNTKGLVQDSVVIKVNNKPTISIAANPTNTSICSTDSVTLTATASNGSSLDWTTGSTANPIVVKTTGDYYVKATLNGCVDSSNTISVSVSQKLPAPTLNCGNTTLSSINYTWQTVNGATGYEVSENKGNSWIQPSSGSTGTSHTRTGLTQNTNYMLWVRATDNAPCNLGIVDSISCNTTNCNAIAYQVKFDSILCAGVNDTIDFNVTSSNNFSILFNGSYTSNTRYIMNANNDSTYNFEIIDSNQLACSSKKVSITILRSLVNLSAAIQGSGACAGVSQTFLATAGFSNYIFKDKQGNVLQNGSSNSYSTSSGAIITAGMDVVASNSLGCQGNASAASGNVFATPTFSASIKGNGACEGASQTFEATAGLANYLFKDKQGNVLQNSSANTFATSNKTIILAGVDIIVTNASGCNASGSAVGGTVLAAPVASFTASLVSKASFQFKTTSAVSINSVWDFGDGKTDTTNKKTITHVYTSSGKFTVKLTEGTAGCSDDTSMQVDAGNVGIGTLGETLFSVYPNPVENILVVDFSSFVGQPTSLELIDMSGQRKIYLTESQLVKNSLLEIATDDLPSGVYIIKIGTLTNGSGYQKVLKY